MPYYEGHVGDQDGSSALYPSDVAAQRVGRDLYIAEKGATPTPEQLEIFMNGAGFWTAKLGEAGDLRKRWPIDWTRDETATPFDLIGRLRREEGRPPPVGPNELDRRGWASLLVRERPLKPTLTGSTDTCWNPAQRLLGLGAISVASAIFLILDLSQPHTGLFRVSPAALEQTIEAVDK